MWYCEVSDWIIVTFFKCRSLKCKDGRKDDVEEQGTHQMWNSKWEIKNSVSGNTSNLNNKHTKKSNDFVLYFKCVTNQTKGNNDCYLFHLKWLKWVLFIAYREKKQKRTHPYIIVLLCNASASIYLNLWGLKRLIIIFNSKSPLIALLNIKSISTNVMQGGFYCEGATSNVAFFWQPDSVNFCRQEVLEESGAATVSCIALAAHLFILLLSTAVFENSME